MSEIINGANMNKSGVYPGWKPMAQTEHDKITIEPLTVTENDTYTAPTGKAYSPVTVNVAGSSIEPFKGLIFDDQITTVMGNVLPESKGDFYLPPVVSADIEFNGVTYANIPCQYDPSDMYVFAWGAGLNEHEQIDFSEYPFRYEVVGTLDPVFYTQSEGTYDVKVTTVVDLSAPPVTFINQTEDEIWISVSGFDAFLCLFPAGSTTILNIPLVGGISFAYEFSDGQIAVSGAANWDSDNSVLQVFGTATVTISSD